MAAEPDHLLEVPAELLLIHRLRGLELVGAPAGARERCWAAVAARLALPGDEEDPEGASLPRRRPCEPLGFSRWSPAPPPRRTAGLTGMTAPRRSAAR